MLDNAAQRKETQLHQSTPPPIDSSGMKILLPTGKTFSLASGIFSDDTSSDSEHGNTNHSSSRPSPILTLPPRERIREKSERRSKKLEENPQGRKPPIDDSSSLNWSWPLDSNPFHSSSQKGSVNSQLMTPPSRRNVHRPVVRLCSDDGHGQGNDEDEMNVKNPCSSSFHAKTSQQICQICSSLGEVWENSKRLTDDGEDFVVSCISCKLFVHLSCYGLELSTNLTNFQCESCHVTRTSTSGQNSYKPKCQLCYQKAGMLRKVPSTSNTWVHPLCVLYTPELTLNVNNFMKPNEISGLDPDRNSLICMICHKKGGSNIQCSHEDCYLSYHPYCGFSSKKQMIIRCIEEGNAKDEGEEDDDEKDEKEDVLEDCKFYYEVYCDKHKKQIPNRETIISSTLPLSEKSKRQLPTGLTQADESDEDEDNKRMRKKRRRSIQSSIASSTPHPFFSRLHKLSSPLPLKSKHQLKSSKTKQDSTDRRMKKKKSSYHHLIEYEAELSGRLISWEIFLIISHCSDSGDERSSECGDGDYDYNDSFINDGEYTQAPSSVETGMAMYHNLHR